jgi:dolichyl-phosphate-mannose-protein mannosyltransferase
MATSRLVAPPADVLERVVPAVPVAAAVLLVGAFTLFLHGFRVTAAPDMLGDEGLYFLVAHNLATGAGLRDDTGIFFWHPPGYPLLESLWIQLTGSLREDYTTALLESRWLNVILSAGSASLLVLLGRRLLNLRAGLLIGLLFAIDLFVQRINRRSMIETMDIFLVLVALNAFYVRWGIPSRRRVVAAGFAFGAAVLTKEVAVIGLVGVGAWVVIFQRQMRGAFVRVAAITAGLYALYVAWGLSVEPDRFLSFKFSAFTRIFAVGRGLVPRDARVDAGADPGVIERLGPAFSSYGPTYFLLAVGAYATLVLFLRHREERGAQLVVCWSAVSYIAVAFGQIGGFGDQYFYYVLVPALVAIGYVGTLWVFPTDPSASRLRTAGRVALVAGFLVVAAYDAVGWVTRYGTGVDDGYAVITRYVQTHVPPGSAIVVDANVSNFLLRPTYDIEFYRDEESVLDQHVQYFILSTKLAEQRYNRMSPDFYDWVRANTTPLVEVNGETYKTMGLYRWDGPTLSDRSDGP